MSLRLTEANENRRIHSPQSMISTVGVALRPPALRPCSRSDLFTRSHLPRNRQAGIADRQFAREENQLATAATDNLSSPRTGPRLLLAAMHICAACLLHGDSQPAHATTARASPTAHPSNRSRTYPELNHAIGSRIYLHRFRLSSF
jgi:hypothetical protein